MTLTRAVKRQRIEAAKDRVVRASLALNKLLDSSSEDDTFAYDNARLDLTEALRELVELEYEQ